VGRQWFEEDLLDSPRVYQAGPRWLLFVRVLDHHGRSGWSVEAVDL
jgi:hypothetical protein